MDLAHSNVYIVRVVDTDADGETRTWFVGPYGSTRSDQVADHLEAAAREGGEVERQCVVEPLFSDDECLRVADYDRRTRGSLY